MSENILNNTCETNNNLKCSKWEIYKNGYYLISGNIIDKKNNLDINDTISSRLIFLAKLQNEGNIKIKFHFIMEEITQNADLEIYINYGLVLKKIITKDDKIDKLIQIETYPLDYGENTIYIKFTKNINSKIDMLINSIIIKGGISSNKCIPCVNSYSNINSSNCIFCKEGEYFDNSIKNCTKCPKNKTTIEKNSIGINSCITVNEKCELKDYITYISPICKNNKNKIKVMKLNKNCYDDENILNKINEKNPICEECPLGLYKEYINLNDWTCVQCDEGLYYDQISKSCLRCNEDSIVNNVTYYYPPFENDEIVLSVFIINDKGEFEINYLENFNISLLIDDKKKVFNKNNKLILLNGQHFIKIKLIPELTIKYIKITNTLNGVGYSCDNINDNFYKKCTSENQFYSIKENKCIECPKLTKPNTKKTFCHFVSNFVYLPLNYHFDLYQLKENAISIRNTHPEWINGNFYGPLINNKINRDYSFYIDNHLGWTLNNDKFKGYIYKKSQINNQIDSLGSIIEYIKIINSQRDIGLIIKYSNGDKCFNDINYSSIIFLRCKNNKYFIDLPKIINYSNCTYYFEMNSRAGCPLCLKSQTWTVESKCYSNQKRYYNFEEDDFCIIPNHEIISEMTSNDINLILTENDNEIISNFNIGNLTKIDENYINKDEIIIVNETIVKNCIDTHKYIKFGEFMIFLYIFVILILIIWKNFGKKIKEASLSKLPNFIYISKSKYDKLPVSINDNKLEIQNFSNNDKIKHNEIELQYEESPVKLNDEKFTF